MSYNYSNFPTKKKKEPNFHPCVPPEDNQIPSGLIKDLQLNGSEYYIHPYKDKNDNVCFYIRRKEERGSKSFTPMSYDPEKKTWVSKAWPSDRPLFREETIKGNDKKIIIAEGEKAVVEAEKKIEFTDYLKLCWSGGSNQVHKTNFEALKDREVILWPDNDEAGLKAMTEVALTLLEKEITDKIKIIKPYENLPKGWDIADPIPYDVENEGLTLGGMLNTANEFNPDLDKKLCDKIRKEWSEREQKEELTKITDNYIYVRAYDEFFEIKTKEFVKLTKLDNHLAHIFKDRNGRGNVSDRLLADPETKKCINYIKLAKRPPGVIEVSSKDNPLITPGKYLNLYNPHEYELIQGDITPFIEFYTRFLGEEQFKHLDRYMAGWYQLPGEKFQNCPVLVSDEGGGKGILANEFIAPALGYKNVATNVSYQNVITEHSTIVRDFSLVVINEVVILKQHNEKVEISNALKGLITDPFVVINEKNKPIINILNTTNFIIYSNSKQCLHLDNSARRYVILISQQTKDDFEQMDNDGVFQKFVDWARSGGSQMVAHYYKKERLLTEQDKKYLYGRAPKTDALNQMIKDSKHPTIKKLEERYEDEAEPFTKEWVGFISKNQLITWIEANIKGHAPDQDIEQWLKEKAIPWHSGDLTRRIQTKDEGRPRVYLLKDRPKDLGDGSYKDWTEGELGYAPTTGTIALSNNAGPMKWGENAKDGTQRAMTLAREFVETPMEVIDMVFKYKKAQEKALKRLDKFNNENPGELDEKVKVGERSVEDNKTETIYDSKRSVIKDEIREQFIKEYEGIFIHERQGSNYGEEQGPQYLGKKNPPNLVFSYEDQELKWRLEDKKTAMLKRHKKESDFSL